MTIQETLDYILQGIVSSPESIKIEVIDENGSLTINITANPEVIGQIIGKEGKIIKSIRTILNLTYPQTRYILNVIG